MVNIAINLEPSPQGRMVFYPTQRVAGVVQLDLSEPKKFRGFYVVISGMATCHWTERRTRTVGTGKDRRTQSYTVSYDGKEVFLNSKTYLFGRHGGESTEIAAGTYRYNFMVELPELIPESLAGSYGSIHYNVEAVLDIPWRFDKEVTVPFTVVRHDNLNDFPDLKIPMRQEEIKTFCCLFCASDPCLITVTIPYGGFAAGQVIPIKVEYANESSSDIDQTKVQLRRTFSFTSSSPETKTKYDTNTMVEIYTDGVKRQQKKIIDCTLTLPAILVSSNMRFCRVVQVSYTVVIECVSSGCHSNPEFHFPITIGTVGIGDDSTLHAGPDVNVTFVPPAYDQMPGGYQPVPQIYPPQPVPSFAPSAPADIESPSKDLPPSFDEAMNSNPQYEKSEFVQPQSTSIGWSVPSAPNEKM